MYMEAGLRVAAQPRQCVRAAKEMDSKSIGLCPQGFESPRCRFPEPSRRESKKRKGKSKAAKSRSTLLIDKTYCARSTPTGAPCSGLFALRLLRSPGERPCLLRRLALKLLHNQDSVSERLRRWTRNPLGSARRGSNSLAVEHAPESGVACHEYVQGPAQCLYALKSHPHATHEHASGSTPTWHT